MTDTPERIYMSHHGVATVWPENAEPAAYVRADLHDAALRDAWIAGRDAAKEECYMSPDQIWGIWIADRISRLTPPDALAQKDAKP